MIATRSGGFPSMINLDPAQPTGWLVPPDDLEALADTLVEAVNGPDELGHRGDAALAYARAELTWSSRVAGFERRTSSPENDTPPPTPPDREGRALSSCRHPTHESYTSSRVVLSDCRCPDPRVAPSSPLS